MTTYLLPPPAPVNAEHLVCGLVASLGRWRPDQFTRFLAWLDGSRDGEPLPALRLNHEAYRLTSSGSEPADVGTCLRFASVPASDGFPGGLLVLAELYPEWAPPVLAGMRGRGDWMAMSAGGVEHVDLARGDGDLWLAEVSLVDRIGQQDDPDALVVGTGPRAASAWELLTGRPFPLTAAEHG